LLKTQKRRNACKPYRASGPITKAGQADIGCLRFIGAMARLDRLGRTRIALGSWLEWMLARKPRMPVVIALANKMARAIWAMMTKKEDYRIPVPTAAAS
jgi:transposase